MTVTQLWINLLTILSFLRQIDTIRSYEKSLSEIQ